MSVTFTTEDPAALLKAFDARIAQTALKGKINTWVKHEDGVHYTHRAPNWKAKAYFKPRTTPGKLVFNIVRPKGKKIDVPVYGYYHGHLIETFLNHFNTSFSNGTASARPTANDIA